MACRQDLLWANWSPGGGVCANLSNSDRGHVVARVATAKMPEAVFNATPTLASRVYHQSVGIATY